MPTYEYRCRECGHVSAVYQSISSYCRAPVVPDCPQHQGNAMERMLSVVPGMNVLAGDRHYDGQRTLDGVDISTRTKHRQYMKERGLTTADDYTQTWAKAQKEREARRTGNFTDQDLRKTIAEVVPQFDK